MLTIWKGQATSSTERPWTCHSTLLPHTDAQIHRNEVFSLHQAFVGGSLSTELPYLALSPGKFSFSLLWMTPESLDKSPFCGFPLHPELSPSGHLPTCTVLSVWWGSTDHCPTEGSPWHVQAGRLCTPAPLPYITRCVPTAPPEARKYLGHYRVELSGFCQSWNGQCDQLILGKPCVDGPAPQTSADQLGPCDNNNYSNSRNFNSKRKALTPCCV